MLQKEMEKAEEVVRGLVADLQRSRQTTWSSVGLAAALTLQLRVILLFMPAVKENAALSMMCNKCYA